MDHVVKYSRPILEKLNLPPPNFSGNSRYMCSARKMGSYVAFQVFELQLILGVRINNKISRFKAEMFPIWISVLQRTVIERQYWRVFRKGSIRSQNFKASQFLKNELGAYKQRKIVTYEIWQNSKLRRYIMSHSDEWFWEVGVFENFSISQPLQFLVKANFV